MTGMSKFNEYMQRRGLGGSPASPLDRLLKITFFAGFAASSKTESVTSLRALMDSLATTRAHRKDALPWLKIASFGTDRTERGSLRHDANLQQIDGIEADYDGEQITVDRARVVLTQANLAAIIYTSPSHTDATPRWRLLCPTSQSMPPAERTRLLGRLNGLFVGALSRESFTLSQAYYYGAIEGNEAHQVLAVEGRAIDLADDLDAEAIGRPERRQPAPAPAAAAPAPRTHAAPRTSYGSSGYGVSALESACNAIRTAGPGQKHETLNRESYSIGGLVTGGELDEGEALAALSEALGAIRHACKDFRAAERTLRNSFRDGMGKPREVPDRLPPPVEEIHPAAAFLAKLTTRRAEVLKAPLPIAPQLMDVPGALRLFVDHCEATAMSPQPFLSLAAGICLVGVLAGRRYRTTTDLRTNVYAVGVADSGGGKDHARKQIKKCLYAANLTQYLGGSDIASGSGLRTAMLRHPAMLFQIDEFGDWLAEVLGDKASSHRKQIAAMLKELYSSANTPWQGTEYADQSRQGRPREDIHHPHACLYGTTTPGQFWSAIAGANLHDGLMARMLLFVSPCSYPDEQEPALLEPSADLVAAIQAIAAGPDAEQGNLGGLMLSSTAPTPMTVPETPEATQARRAMRQDQLAQQRAAEGTYVTSIAARLAENAMKLALIRAVSRDPAAPIIRADDVAWGRALAQHCIDTLLRDAGRNVADNEYEAKLNKAAEIIRKHGPLSHRDMVRRGFKLPERERAEILRTLIDGGMITEIVTTPVGPGRPSVRYAIHEGVPE